MPLLSSFFSAGTKWKLSKNRKSHHLFLPQPTQLSFPPGEVKARCDSQAPFAPPPPSPPNTEQKFTSASAVFKLPQDDTHTGRMAGGPQLASAGTVHREASLLGMKRLHLAPWASLGLSLAFLSFHPVYLAGRTVGFILARLGRGREGGGEEAGGGFLGSGWSCSKERGNRAFSSEGLGWRG